MAVFFFKLGQQFISTAKQQRGFFFFLLLLIIKEDGLEEDGLGGGRSHLDCYFVFVDIVGSVLLL